VTGRRAGSRSAELRGERGEAHTLPCGVPSIMAISTTLVLADDHQLLRQSLRALLEREGDFKVIGEAGDGLTAAEVVERLEPDVLVLGVMLPGLSGLEVARQVSLRTRRTRIVILSMLADVSCVVEALRNGASAYVLKCAAFEDLVRAIREATAGRRYLCPPLSEQAASIYREAADPTSSDKYEKLTDRERQVLQLVAEGSTSAAIAKRLGISPRTVETHRANIAKKLGFRNQTDLIAFALRRGLISKEI